MARAAGGRPPARLAAAVLLVAPALLAAGCRDAWRQAPADPHGQPGEVAVLAASDWSDRFAPPPPADTLRFRSGDTLDALLRRLDLPGEERRNIARAVAAAHDLGSFRAGQAIVCLRDAGGAVVGLQCPLDFTRDLCAWRGATGWRAAVLTADLDWRPRVLTAELERSFVESFTAQGEDGDLAVRVADLFAGEVDFFFDLRRGDRMELLVETAHRPDRGARHDRVLAARLVLDGEGNTAYLFPDSTGGNRYFHADGGSLARQFLRAPLRFTRVSSGFSRDRLHPVLGVHRPHWGVDYAAPAGTPVMATADGVVREKRCGSEAGRFVRLRHAGGIETYYMHLSRWARGVSPGARVRKGQVIGYVGQTGLATGPHLDYRIRTDGRYVDPRRFRSGPAAPLPEADRAAFAARVAETDRLWRTLAREQAAVQRAAADPFRLAAAESLQTSITP
ncbi:MAG: M23 family metallopeptidase [Candidatus Krumholzibacteriota bacterium]|nr:M23 family metallopeptidase [Candidatus Krumholzibacteriota bacterium]